MKRILFLVSSMEGGGAERVAALLCNHWVSRGHQVTLMPTFSGRGDCSYALDERVRLDYLADHVSAGRRSAWTKLRRLLALRRVIRHERPDVVVSFLPHVNVAAILAGLGSGVPVVVSERTYPPALALSSALERLRRRLYPFASAVVMQTRQGREWLATIAPRARGAVIPNPVAYPLPGAAPRLPPADVIADERKILLAVGRLSDEKRLAGLIAAFAALAGDHPQWDLVILGEGDERAALEAQRDSLGLHARIHLPGWVGNLADWYRRASLYVLNSRFEGFPNALMEAMAYGLPAVSVDCATGPRDIIRHDVDGWLVAVDEDGAQLTRALDALMSDPSRRSRLGAAAAAARERFSLARVAVEWDRVLGLE